MNRIRKGDVAAILTDGSGTGKEGRVVSSRRKDKPTPIEARLLSFGGQEDSSPLLFQHTLLCQTSLPYRDPGPDMRIWQRRNGNVHLELQAGRALHPDTRDFVDIGLPWGSKARLALLHLNAEAIRTQSPCVELEDSLTAFVCRILGQADPGGRTIRGVNEQLSRLAAADFRFGVAHDGRSITVKGSIIEGLELWSPRDSRQKVLWPSTVHFGARYFESLIKHAVPLSEDAVAALSHTCMGLDVYVWLAERLHRVPPDKSQLVPWISLLEQFGQGYDRINDFKPRFKKALRQVKAVYDAARYSLSFKGMYLHQSEPPVRKKYISGR